MRSCPGQTGATRCYPDGFHAIGGGWSPITDSAIMGPVIGQYSIRINDQYRVCFRWEEGHADEVEITDYH